LARFKASGGYLELELLSNADKDIRFLKNKAGLFLAQPFRIAQQVIILLSDFRL